MAQRHLDPTAGPVPADALAGYLRDQATEFLRALRLHRETGAGAAASDGSVEAARALRRAARRISASLHTFQPVLDPDWSEAMRPELAWVSGTLALEHACTSRLDQLLLALHRLSGAPPLPARGTATPRTRALAGMTLGTPGTTASATATAAAHGEKALQGPPVPDHETRTGGASGNGFPAEGAAEAEHPTRLRRTITATADRKAATPDRGNLTVGAAKAGALLDRQLTLARTRAHSTALQALGSSRFHAVADKVAVLASEVPLSPAAAGADLRPLADAARERLADAVAALPLLTAGSPYNAEALIHGLSPDPAPHPQDAPWHQVRLLLRLHRYALEVLHAGPDPGLLAAGEALDRHRDASEAAAAAAQAARTPRIAPATAYALGVLHADQRHEVEAARYAFQRSWQKVTIGTL
ncbi:CHAD domain-containing protein [Streptomyces sp. AC558_RSS880]|uniref:CHAD domain-containing protein n=1 Tax=Streptomyces sp. AC558_RSS880 TaxID=2823687 RepID=UPI001C215396|nr:CHAD domain-containing protein [Streptomyces sp. AC558_RSS880]